MFTLYARCTVSVTNLRFKDFPTCPCNPCNTHFAHYTNIQNYSCVTLKLWEHKSTIRIFSTPSQNFKTWWNRERGLIFPLLQSMLGALKRERVIDLLEWLYSIRQILLYEVLEFLQIIVFDNEIFKINV